MKAEITRKGERFHVRTPYSPLLVDRFRVIPGREFHGDDKSWSFPLVRDVLLMVCDACGVLPWMLEDDLRDLAGSNGVQAIERIALDMRVIEGHHFITKPYQHQKVNLARLIQNDRWLLADEMGTGKSHAVANRLLSLLRIQDFVLIVCPKSVINVWKDQLQEHANILCDTLDGEISSIKKTLQNPSWIKVVNYEMLQHHPAWFLDGHTWQALVLDEIHRVKNFTTKTSKVVRQLSARTKHVYGLSGTPAPNGLEDWFGVLSAIDPTLLPVNTKTAFEARYCVKTKLPNGVFKISGYRNVAELHTYIASIASRVTKKVCTDLPEKVYSTRKVTLEGEQRRIYQELKRDAVARLTKLSHSLAKNGGIVFKKPVLTISPEPNIELTDAGTLTINNVLTESLRLLQVVGGFVPDDDGVIHEIENKAKLAALEDVLEELGDKQCVIWCAFRAEVAFLMHWLVSNHKGLVASLTGETSSEVREENIEMFRKGDARFFVGTASAGGLGINGLQVADTEVYWSRDWNLATYLQSQDRLHRIGQKNTVHVIKLVAANTVDEKVDEALERKTGMQEMMLTDPEKLF